MNFPLNKSGNIENIDNIDFHDGFDKEIESEDVKKNEPLCGKEGSIDSDFCSKKKQKVFRKTKNENEREKKMTTVKNRKNNMLNAIKANRNYNARPNKNHLVIKSEEIFGNIPQNI